jgi:hypothetical protein
LSSRATVEALCFFDVAKVIQIVRHLANLSWGDATALCSRIITVKLSIWHSYGRNQREGILMLHRSIS